MANNWQRLNIWLNQEDKFNYEQHIQGCREADCAALPPLEFAQKAGMISCAMEAFPELPVAEAYLAFIQKNQIAFTPPQLQAPPPIQLGETKGCCGGGQVR